MREGVAVSKPSDTDELSNVIPFPERAVGYTGPALKLMAGLAKIAVTLDKALQVNGASSLRPKIEETLGHVAETIAMIEEHMDALNENREAIQNFLENGDVAYFSKDANGVPVEIVSLFESRQAMLMVGKLFFRADQTKLMKLDPDNDCQVLLTYDGRFACKWPRTP